MKAGSRIARCFETATLDVKTIAIVVLPPVAVQTVLIILAARFEQSVPWYGNFWSPTFSSFVGYAFLVGRFRWKVLPFFMVYCSLVIAAVVYGESL